MLTIGCSVYTVCIYYLKQGRKMATTTRTFKSGNSIAVRIPREFNLEPGKTLEIKRRGKELILVEHEETLAGLINAFKSFPADFFADGRNDAMPRLIPAFEPAKNSKQKTGIKTAATLALRKRKV